MVKWEHAQMIVVSEEPFPIEELNESGLYGWQLVQLTTEDPSHGKYTHTATMKREIDNEPV